MARDLKLSFLFASGAFSCLAALVLLTAPSAAAPPVSAWSSPGTGISYDLSSLEAGSGGVVQDMGAPPLCHFNVQDYLTISNNDTLTIPAGCLLEFDSPSGFIIEGRLLVDGASLNPVVFTSTGGPAPGDYDGIVLQGSAFAPSRISNLSMDWSTFGVRCDGCVGLQVDGLRVGSPSGDGLQLIGGAHDVSVRTLIVTVSSYMAQSAVGISRASNVTGSGIYATGTATILTLWNCSNVTFSGPFGSSSITLYGAWVSNSSNVSILGLNGTGLPTGALVEGSTDVELSNASFLSPTGGGLRLTGTNRARVTDLQVTNSSGFGLSARANNSAFSRLNLSSAGPAVFAAGTNLRFDNVSASSPTAPLTVDASAAISITDSAFSGGTPAGISITNVSVAVLDNVSARSATTGFLVLSSTGVMISHSNGSANTADGLGASLGADLTVDNSTFVGNGGRGLSVTSIPSFTLRALAVQGNGLEGLFCSNVSGSIFGLSASGNALDGVAVTNSSSVRLEELTLLANLRNGVWVRSGSSVELASSSALSNAGSGATAEGATLNLFDGAFQNNSLYGIYWAANATGSWQVNASATLADNPAVLSGGVTGNGAGSLLVLRATVDLRGTLGLPFLVAFHNGAALRLESATLRPFNASAQYALLFDGGARFVALGFMLDSPGSTATGESVALVGATAQLEDGVFSGPQQAVRLDGSTMDATNVSFQSVFGITALSASSSNVSLTATTFQGSGVALAVANSTVALQGVTIDGAFSVGVSATAGSSLSLEGTTIRAVLQDAVVLNSGASLVMRNSSIFSAGWSAIEATGSAGILLDSVSLDAQTAGFSLNGSGDVIARAVWVTSPGAGISLNRPGPVILEGLVVRVAGQALFIANFTTAALSNSTLNSTGGEGASFGPGSLLVLANSSVISVNDGVRMSSVGGASVFGVSISVSGPSAGLRMRDCPGALLSNVAVAAPSGIGLGINASSGVSLSAVQIRGGSIGLLLEDSQDFTATALQVDSAAASVSVRGGSALISAPLLANGTAVGVESFSNASVALHGGSVAGAAGAPGFAPANAHDASRIQLYDTAASNASMSSSEGSLIQVFWTLTVGVRLGGAPMANVSISLWNGSGGLLLNATSNASGWTPPALVLEFEQTAAGRVYRSPYTASAAVGSGFGGSVSFNLTKPTTVFIDIVDLEPPRLLPRFSPQRVVANRTLSYSLQLGDSDNVGIAGYEWSFMNETGVMVTVTDAPLSYAFAAPGRYQVTLAARDAQGNTASTGFLVWVNAAPYFVAPPSSEEMVGLVGVPFTHTFAAGDPDPEDLVNLTFRLVGESPMSLSGGTLSWTPSAPGVFSATIFVTDGLDQTSFHFDLLVGSDEVGNRPPSFVTEPRQDANLSGPYVYDVLVEDPDAGDFVVIQLLAGPAGMTLTQAVGFPSAQVLWSPASYFPRQAEAFNISFNISMRAWDTHVFVYQNFTLTLRNPPDQRPRILPMDDIVLTPGLVLKIDLRQFGADDDDDPLTLKWSIVQPPDTAGVVIGFDTQDPFTAVIRAPSTAPGSSSFFITFVLKDSSGLSDKRTVNVRLLAPSGAEAAFPWLFLILALAVIGAAFALATRHGGPGADLDSGAEPGGGEGRGGLPSPSEATGPAADAAFPMYLEAVALFDMSGELVASATKEGADAESVLVSVPSQLNMRPPQEDTMDQLPVEGRDVAFLRRGDAVMAAVGSFAGDVSPWLADPMGEALAHIHGIATETNVDSLGALANHASVREALHGVLALTAGVSSDAVERYLAARAVRIGSVVEVLQGFVRLKVAVDNNSGELAADVRLSLDFDDKVLRLDQVDPKLETRRDRIQLGNLRPGERKTVAFYFDPQICTRSFVNATASFEDPKGRFHTSVMRTRAVEVVCPAFSTPRKANTAMLRRLLTEELSSRDSKYFRFPAETSPERVFEGCKQAVLAQDVQLVREFVAERPYQAEAWFYGETKVAKAQVVIWTTVFGKQRVAQFSVSSNAPASITGLLAELGRRLIETRAGGGIGAPIETLGKSQATAEVGTGPTLLSKSESAEAEPHEG